MTNIILTNVGNLQDTTSAQNVINANSAAIVTAVEASYPFTGGTLQGPVDMNSFQMLNLPVPATSNSPARLQDVINTSVPGGIISNIPAGGIAGSSLTKLSGADYNYGWSSSASNNSAGLNIALSGANPVQISTLTNPVFTGGVTTPSLINTGTLNLPTTNDTLVGRITTDTLQNKTISTGSTWSGNLIAGTFGGTGVNNGANLITVAGNLTTVGSSALTLTTTGVTNSTLPSGTHTLPALDVANIFTAVQTITSNTNPQHIIQTASGDNATIQVAGATNTIQLGESSTEGFVKVTTNNPLGLWTNNTERFTISAAGGMYSTGVTGGDKGVGTINCSNIYINGNLQNYPAFQAIRTSSQTLTAGTPAKIQFDTKIFDTNTYYDNTTNYRFTPLVAGKYIVNLNGQVSATWTTGQYLNVYIQKNGTTINGGFSSIYPETGAGSTIQGTTGIVTMNGSTDYIEGWVGTTGVSPSVVGQAAPSNTSFSAFYLGP